MKLHFLKAVPVTLIAIFYSFSPAQAQVVVNVGINQPAHMIASAGLDHHICPEDSVAIGGTPAATGGTGPFTYSWSPATGLSSSSVSNPFAHPLGSTSYLLQISDSRGCVSSDSVSVMVDTCTGISPSLAIQGLSLTLYPNPNSGSFSVLLEGDHGSAPFTIEISNSLGQKIWNSEILFVNGRTEKAISLPGIRKGIYILSVKSNDKITARRIVIE